MLLESKNSTTKNLATASINRGLMKKKGAPVDREQGGKRYSVPRLNRIDEDRSLSPDIDLDQAFGAPMPKPKGSKKSQKVYIEY